MCSCVPSQIQYALADLPDTLDETYQRTLRNINNAHWEFAHRLFQFVAVASRPLRVEELAELLAFDFEAGPIPKFDEDCRLEDPIDAVLSTCSSLLAIVDGEYGVGKVIQFSHFSVKEYLTSPRLAEANDIIPRRYHVSMTPAHTLAAQICLGILLHLDKDVVTRENLEKWPLAEYAAKHWVDHALFEGVSQNVEDGLKQLFDPGKSHLAVCVWMENQGWKYGIYDERPLSPLKTSLHFAALWGLHFMVEFLVIECSQNVCSEGFYNNVTPLHVASERGHVKICRMLIEHGAGVMAQNRDRETPLHLASREGQVEVARVLIERGADVTAQNKDGRTPLHLVVEWRHKELVRMLIERGADVQVQTNDGETPLLLALTSNWDYDESDVEIEAVHMLIVSGADVAAHNKQGWTPLHLAAELGQTELVRMLIERGADVQVQTNNGETPLLLAFSPDPHSCDVEMKAVHVLIESGADVAAHNKEGETPLHLAAGAAKWRGGEEVVHKLIERGADVAAQNKDGQTPLHMALCSEGWGDVEVEVEVVLMLIEHGADLAAQNKKGETPLHLAAKWRTAEEVVHKLIERGADVAAQNKDGQTPLHLALDSEIDSRSVDVEVVLMLIERGADLAAQNKKGETPLHLASRPNLHSFELERHAEICRKLLEQGADVNAKNNAGFTPLRLASQSGHLEDPRVQVLLQHGADPGDVTGEDLLGHL